MPHQLTQTQKFKNMGFNMTRKARGFRQNTWRVECEHCIGGDRGWQKGDPTPRHEGLCQSRPEAREERMDLRDIIERGLKDYRMQFTVDDDGDSLPLIDALNPPSDRTVERGLEEAHLLADFLWTVIDDTGYLARPVLRG